MSQFDYIGSPKPIKLGTYGSTRLYIEKIEIIDHKTAIVNNGIEISAGILSFEGKDLEWFRNALLIFEDNIAAGVHINSILSGGDAIRDQFENEYVYMIQMHTSSEKPNNVSPKRLTELQKDHETLVKLFKDLAIGEGFFELFSSWANEEGEPRNQARDQMISIDDFEGLDYITLKDRQYIRILI